MRGQRQAQSRMYDGRENEGRDSEIPYEIDLNYGGQGFPEVPVPPGMHLTWVRVPTENLKDASALQTLFGNPQIPIQAVDPSTVPALKYLETVSVFTNSNVIQYKDTIACMMPQKVYEAIQRGNLGAADRQIQSISKRSPHRDLNATFAQKAEYVQFQSGNSVLPE